VKRLGALYLRDGVCVLPDMQASRAGLESLAERVQEFGGQANLIWSARLSPTAAAALHAEFIAARQTEYAEVTDAALELLQHVRAEAMHHSLDKAVRLTLGADLARLERWLRQVIARDYLQVGDPGVVAATLADCRRELQQHALTTARVAS
jgi:hypothetical protein